MNFKGILPYVTLSATAALGACNISQTDNVITSLRNLGYTEAQINELLSSDSLEIPLYIVENGLKAELYTALTSAPEYKDDLFFRYIPLVVKYSSATVTTNEIVSVVNGLYDELGYRQDQFISIKVSRLTFDDVKKLLEHKIDPVILTRIYNNKDRNANFDSKYLETLIKITDGRSSDFLSGQAFDIKKIIGGTNVLDIINFDYSDMQASGLIELFEYIDTIIKRSEELALGSLGHTWESIERLNPTQKETVRRKIEEFLNRYLQENQDSISSVAGLIKDKTPVIASIAQVGAVFEYVNNTLRIPIGSITAGTTIQSLIASNIDIVASYREAGSTIDISTLLTYEIETGFNPNELGRYTVKASIAGTTTTVDELAGVGKYLSSSSNIFIEIIDVDPTFENIFGNMASGDSRERFMTINAVLLPQALTTIDNALSDIKFNYAGTTFTTASDEVEIRYYKFDSVIREFVPTTRADAIGNVHRIRVQVIFTTKSGREINFTSEINISTSDVLPPIVILDTYNTNMELGDTAQAVLGRVNITSISDNATDLQDLIIRKQFEINGTLYDTNTVDLSTLNIVPNQRIKYIVTAEDEEGNVGRAESNITVTDNFAPSITFTGIGSSSSNPLRYTNNDIFTNVAGIQAFVNSQTLNLSITDNDTVWAASNPTITIGNNVGGNSYHNINTFEYSITDRGGNRATGFIYIAAVDSQVPVTYVLGDNHLGFAQRPHYWKADVDLKGLLVGYVSDNDWTFAPNGKRPIQASDITQVVYKKSGTHLWNSGSVIPYRDMSGISWSVTNNTETDDKKSGLFGYYEKYDVQFTVAATDPSGNTSNATYIYRDVKVQHGHPTYNDAFIDVAFASSPTALFGDAVAGPNGEMDWNHVENGTLAPIYSPYNTPSDPRLPVPEHHWQSVIGGQNYPFILVHVYTSKDMNFVMNSEPNSSWNAKWTTMYNNFIGTYGANNMNSNFTINNPLMYENEAYKHWAIPFSPSSIVHLNLPFKNGVNAPTNAFHTEYRGAWDVPIKFF